MKKLSLFSHRTRKGEGKTAAKVMALLEQALQTDYPGVNIDSSDLWFQEGDYRKATWDMAGWGANIPYGSRHIKISSWDTMTACAKGLTLFTPKGAIVDEFEAVSLSDPK